MRNALVSSATAFFIFASAASAAAPIDSMDRKPLVIGTKIESGQIVHGSPTAEVDPDDYYVSQIGVSFTQEVVVNHRLNIKAGVGGVFYSTFPTAVNNTGSGLGVKFGPGITQ